MPLFDRLLRLHLGSTPTEDFFTEVVAHLLATDSALCMQWLREAGVLEGDRSTEEVAVRVGTQQRFSALFGHDCASRPDIVLWIDRPEGDPDLLLVESKVGSGEGPEQLRRYVEHLAQMGPARRRILIYITRDADPKDMDDVLRGLGSGDEHAAEVEFISLRWRDFYRVLQHHTAERPDDSLLTETLRFMEAHSMDSHDEFTPLDALALSHIRRTLAFMEDALRSGPAERFKRLLGGVSRSSSSLTQLRDHGRYVVYQTFERGTFEVLLGFFRVSGRDYPELGLSIGASPNGESVERTLQAMGSRAGWSYQDLRPGVTWVFAHRRVPMQSLLVQENHAQAVTSTLDAFLNELEEVMDTYDTLPWKATADPEVTDTQAG